MRVIIADDEKYVRLALKDTLQHLTIPIEVVGEATDGREAYELCLTYRPDILITDICMPEEDGFVLLEKVRQDFPDLPVIIYSGYDDFSFAQRAIRYKIAEYLLKPVDEEKLEEAINNIRNNYQSNVTERKSSIRNEILYNITRCKKMDSLLEWMADTIKTDASNVFQDIKSCSMELIYVQEYDSMEKEKWEEFFAENTVYSWCLDEEKGFLLMICRNQEKEAVLSKAEEIYQNSVFLHESRMLSDKIISARKRFEEIMKCWIEMNKSIQFYFWKEFDCTLMDETECPSKRVGEQFNQEYLGQMNAAIRLGKKDYMKEVEKVYWDKLLREFRGTDSVFVKSTIKNFLGKTMLLLNCSVESCEEVSKHMKKSSRLLKANQVFALMRACSDEIFEIYQKENAGDAVANMKDVITVYLEGHYNQDVTLEMLAQYLHFNVNYTSTLFKKVMEKNFVTYLTELRITKAKLLLRSGEFRIYEVANEVGYEDERYFQKLFKKITGVTPKEYKQGKESKEK